MIIIQSMFLSTTTVTLMASMVACIWNLLCCLLEIALMTGSIKRRNFLGPEVQNQINWIWFHLFLISNSILSITCSCMIINSLVPISHLLAAITIPNISIIQSVILIQLVHRDVVQLRRTGVVWILVLFCRQNRFKTRVDEVLPYQAKQIMLQWRRRRVLKGLLS